MERASTRQVLQAGARHGHWGLPGIRERAKRIGAQLKLWSETGAGTEVELTVPARIAYGTVHRRERIAAVSQEQGAIVTTGHKPIQVPAGVS